MGTLVKSNIVYVCVCGEGWGLGVIGLELGRGFSVTEFDLGTCTCIEYFIQHEQTLIALRRSLNEFT